jgi:hypothetical protein
MSGRFSGQDYEAIERRIAQQDRNVKPKLGPKRNALNNAEIDRLRQQLLAFARSF